MLVGSRTRTAQPKFGDVYADSGIDGTAVHVRSPCGEFRAQCSGNHERLLEVFQQRVHV
jgi:hypothetical protein